MTEKNNTLVIIRGLSGSGKTTLAEQICDASQEDRIAIAADDFFYDEDDVYRFDAEQLKDAHEWCKQEVESCMVQAFNIIAVHNTFTRRWEVEPYIELANKHGYQVSVVSLFDAGMNDVQLAKRSLHGIPVSSVRAQRNRWEEDIFRTETSSRQNRLNAHRYPRRPYPQGKLNYPKSRQSF